MEVKELKQTILEYLSNKKATDILSINVSEKTIVADYYIVASGKSTTHVKSLCENLEEELSKKYGVEPLRREGIRDGRWAVLDYGDVIVHVFNDEMRLFYHLERLWDEGDNVERFED
ncbi:MAG: ribosome silencing factor [Clostridiales bacterium]|nr:ribosome silencing factor [Clostridiales bacterium]